jgi:large subunit ribosomal protein L24
VSKKREIAMKAIELKAGRRRVRSDIKVGDTVIVIAGGNSKKRENKGKTGKVLRFVGAEKVVVEGLNIVTRHRKAAGPDKLGGKTPMEAPIHLSNVMYYSDKAKAGVKVIFQKLADGKKARGYKDPESGKFVQIESK